MTSLSLRGGGGHLIDFQDLVARADPRLASRAAFEHLVITMTTSRQPSLIPRSRNGGEGLAILLSALGFRR